ncbi:helix-turn-helix transcriptional regulator [Longispora albida]|uniref:helix-turn-helix transcriptional regulator n=1 Tax=Longispora albida TaxID=203523 RepID=UPI00035D1019|nr:YafY family protein [Longispora albida]
MANTSSRTLRLLSFLQTHRYWPGSELAERLDVSPRTLRRDIDRLRELGYPVDASRGVDGGYQLAAGAALPPLVMDDDEAVALAVGLQTSAMAGAEEASVRALAKVIQVMPPRLRKRVDALRAVTVPAQFSSGPVIDAQTLTVVAQACRDTERIRFGYTAHGGETSHREAEPHRLVPYGRRWYLIAYDLTRHAWRSFRLDRLTEPAPTGHRFRPRDLPAADAAEFLKTSLGNLAPAPTYQIEVFMHAAAETIRSRFGQWLTVTDAPGGCLISMTTDSMDWAALALGAAGAEFEVRSPPEFAEYIKDWAARFTRAAQSLTTGH